MLILVNRWFDAMVHWLVRASKNISSYAVLAMALIMTADVLARTLLGIGTKWTVEVSGYLLVVATFLALGYTLQEDAHIKMDILITKLPKRVQTWLCLVACILFLTYTVLLCVFTWKQFVMSFVLKTPSPTGTDIVLWPIQLFIPLGLALISLKLLQQIRDGIKTAGKKEPKK